jgi:hypothetical protein
MSWTGDWTAAALEDLAAVLAGRVAAWNHGAGPEDVPGPGGHDADAITAGHRAVTAIDQMLRELHLLRARLIVELRQDEAARAARVDAMLEQARDRRESESESGDGG